MAWYEFDIQPSKLDGESFLRYTKTESKASSEKFMPCFGSRENPGDTNVVYIIEILRYSYSSAFVTPPSSPTAHLSMAKMYTRHHTQSRTSVTTCLNDNLRVANGAVNAIKMSDRPSSATVPFIIAAQKPQPQPLGVHTETARAPSPLVCAVSCSEHLTVCTLYAPSFRHTRLNVNDAVDHAYYNIWTFTAHAHTQTYNTKSPTKKTVRTRQTWRVNMHANESTATRMGSVGRYQGALCMCTISRRPWPWHTFCDAPKYERAREREQEQANTSETYIQDSTNTIVNKMPDTSSLSWLFCVFQCVCCCVWSCA